MKKVYLLLFCTALLFLFSACASDDATRLSSAAPESAPPSTYTDAVPSPVDIASPAPAETSAPVPAPVAEVHIQTPDEWNTFARAFNDGAVPYADSIVVTIECNLDFSGVTFVPLYSGFSGTIRGPVEAPQDEQDEAREARLREESYMDKMFPNMRRSGTFMNITEIEAISGDPVTAEGLDMPAAGKSRAGEFTESTALFGISCNALTLESVTFYNVDSSLIDCLFTQSAGDLTVRNVGIFNCHLSDGNALLALNAATADIENLLVSGVRLDGETQMSGLLYWVADSARFHNVHMYHSDFLLAPDLGSSYFNGAIHGMLAYRIMGSASFENIELYNCHANAIEVLALASQAGMITVCDNIRVDSCSLLAYLPATPGSSREFNFTSQGDLLFDTTADMPVFETNILFRNSLLCTRSELDVYRARGYAIENCVRVVD